MGLAGVIHSRGNRRPSKPVLLKAWANLLGAGRGAAVSIRAIIMIMVAGPYFYEAQLIGPGGHATGHARPLGLSGATGKI